MWWSRSRSSARFPLPIVPAPDAGAMGPGANAAGVRSIRVVRSNTMNNQDSWSGVSLPDLQAPPSCVRYQGILSPWRRGLQIPHSAVRLSRPVPDNFSPAGRSFSVPAHASSHSRHSPWLPLPGSPSVARASPLPFDLFISSLLAFFVAFSSVMGGGVVPVMLFRGICGCVALITIVVAWRGRRGLMQMLMGDRTSERSGVSDFQALSDFRNLSDFRTSNVGHHEGDRQRRREGIRHRRL